MKRSLPIIILFLSFSIHSQSIKKTLINKESLDPIEAGHIYLKNAQRTGTISNSDGLFILKNLEPQDSLYISHLGFTPMELSISEIDNDTILMTPLTEDLKEVVLLGTSARGILEKAIGLMEENHAVEPVLYRVFIRDQEYEEDLSQLHLFSEFVVNLYQTKNHNSKFEILKGRANFYSEKGKENFKSRRLISPSFIFQDNIFKYKYDFFKKRKLKKYDIAYGEGIPNSDSYIITCRKKEETSEFVLHIDKETFAIQKIKKFNSKGLVEEIGFKKVEGKYYLDHSLRINHSYYYPGIVSRTDAIYNIENIKEFDKKQVQGRNIMVGHISDFTGSWSDSYWADYNYLPIPGWTKNLMKQLNIN